MIGVYDRKRALHDMAKNEDVDVITGDWMSECNMTVRGYDKVARTVDAIGYEQSFVEKLDPAIPWLAKKGTKVAVNAGASDVPGLAEAVKALVKKHGVDLKVAYVDGDDVTEEFMKLYNKGKVSNFSLDNLMAETHRRAILQSPGEQGHSRLGLQTHRSTMLSRRVWRSRVLSLRS